MMSVSSLSILLLVFIVSAESMFHVYTYDDGHGNDEHCCLVRVRDKFCLATPITRSLIQVNKQCHQTHRRRHRRRGGKKRNDKYLDKISRRLNVESVKEMDDRILIGLRTPLEQTVLDRDLVCLASTKHNTDLDKCSIELANPLDDYLADNDEQAKKNKRHRMRPSGGRKRESNVVVDQEHDDDHREEVNRIEVGQPVRVREGHGLVIRQIYRLNPNNIRPDSRAERQCWSWYRQQTRKIRSAPSKPQTSCIPLNDHREQCIEQLAHVSKNSTEPRELASWHSLSIGSKLFCANQQGESQLIGHYNRGKICFQKDNQITVEHQFTDIPNLSDVHKNSGTLNFISKNAKFQAEFENDCLNETSLVEATEPVKPRQVTPKKESPSE